MGSQLSSDREDEPEKRPHKEKRQQRQEEEEEEVVIDDIDESAITRERDVIIDSSRNAQIMAECRRRGRLFEDKDFPADASSLTFSGEDLLKVKWLRPHEIDGQPQFISDGFSRGDIGQGQLGDCWILASLAGLAVRPELIRQIVPGGQSMTSEQGYCGAFRFRFRRFGQVVEVMVDDRLPTRGGCMLYAQHVCGEFWVCLLEKALAKLAGCYQSLESGQIFEALTDMTGGVCEEIEVSDSTDNSNLSDIVARCLSKGCVIGASTISDGTGEDCEMNNGLVYSHAYTVTGATTVQEKRGSRNSRWRSVNLIRLRNPWGTSEWQGKWSDHYSGWSDEQRRAVGLVAADDGEFWMEMDNFVRFYNSLSILHLAAGSNAATGRGEWRSREFRGEWIAGSTAGGQPYYDSHPDNPIFEMDLTDSASDNDSHATCLVSLEEPAQRDKASQARSYVPKAVYLYPAEHVVQGRLKPLAHYVANTGNFVLARNCVHTFRVQPGRYAFVPCTHEPNQEAPFLLRVFTEA